MKITYDNIGDILYLEFVESYAEQESDMVSDTVVVRTNPHNGRVESFEFLFFSEILRRGEPFDLPIGPDLVPDWNTIAAITREHETPQTASVMSEGTREPILIRHRASRCKPAGVSSSPVP